MREYSSETCLQFETSDTERSPQGNQINNGVERRDPPPEQAVIYPSYPPVIRLRMANCYCWK